jgi:modulator of FtsH protease
MATTNPLYTSSASANQLAQNKVLRNTYLLLSMTLLFSAAVATTSAVLNLPHPGFLLTLVGFFGLFFLTSKNKDSTAGLYCVFALTGFMGYTIGPMLSAYWSMAPIVVIQAFTGTSAIFIGMSFYAMNSKRDFSFMGPSLMIGMIVALLAGIGAFIFKMPALSLAVSAAFVILMSGMILYETNQIVRGGETNYIMATVSLFISIYNLFTSLLHLLGFAHGD